MLIIIAYIYYIFFASAGGIGVGKSEAMYQLGLLHPDWVILYEPVDQWSSCESQPGIRHNLLSNYYHNPSEVTFRVLQVGFQKYF